MAVNVLEQLQRQQEMASQQQESLSQRLARQDAFNSSVDPAIRAQALDFSNRPTLANPLDTIAGQLDLGERARSQRSAIAEDLGRVQSQSMDLLTKIGSEQQRRASAGGATKTKTASEELSRMAGLADALGLDKQKLIQSRPDLIAQAFGLEDMLLVGETQQPEPSLLTAGARGMQVGTEQATGQPMPEIERQQPTGFEAIQQLFKPATPKLEGKEKRDAEQALRTELEDAAVKNDFFEIRNANRTVQSAKENAAGDLSLIFSYMKILDPGSTVREGEFANAQNAASVPQQIRNIYNKVQRGERLNTEQRSQFKDQAQSIYNQTAQRQQELNEFYADLAEQNGINPENITKIIGDIEIDEKGQVNQFNQNDPLVQKAISEGFTPEQIQAYLSQRGQ